MVPAGGRGEPYLAEPHVRLGTSLLAKGWLDEAVAEFQSAVAIKPDYPQALAGLSNAFRMLGWADQALNAANQAIKLKADYAEAHVAKALACLLAGDLSRGWKELDWRRRCKGFGFPSRHSNRLQWDGSDLLNQTVLVHAELTLEDTLQFVRYIPSAAQGGVAVLECPRVLHELMRSVRGVRDVCAADEPPPPFDLQCPLLTIPLLRMTTSETIPADVPYLAPSAAKVEASAQKLGPRQAEVRVGLAWASEAKIPAEAAKSCALEAFGALAAFKAEFVSLQTGPAAAQAQRPPAGMRVIDLSAEVRSYADVASLIANVDLVVCVDSPVAHVAAAMAKPTHLLLPLAADWRWLMNRDTSPWYPTLRLYRQRVRGDWAGAVARVVQALAQPA